MILARFDYPRETHLFIAPERPRGVKVYEDKGQGGGGLLRATESDRIGTKRPQKEGDTP